MKLFTIPKFFQGVIKVAFNGKEQITVGDFNQRIGSSLHLPKASLNVIRADLNRIGLVEEYQGKLKPTPLLNGRFEGVSFRLGSGADVKKEMEHKRKAIVEFIPLSIGLAIALIVIVSVTIPIVNATTYQATTVWGGTTGTILSQLLPLVAVLSIAAVASVLMSIFRA